MQGRPSPTVLLVFALTTLVGGANFVAVRYSNRELAPFWGAGARFALAGLLLLAISLAFRLGLPRGRAAVGAVVYGVLAFGLTYALMYQALVVAPAAVASVMIALVPLETLLIASAFGLERLHARGILGAIVALAGTAVVFADRLGTNVPFTALLAIAAASLCVSASTVIIKGFPRVHPVPTNAYAMLPGAAILLVLSLVAGERWVLPVRAEVIGAFAYLVLVGSTALFIGFLYVLQRWTASAASYTTVLFPVVTVALGAALAGEAVTLAFVVGAALVIVGVYIGAIASHTPTSARPSA